MNGLIGLISLSALLLAVSGQLSTLSPSFSLQGAITSANTTTGSALAGTYSVSVDITRRLQFADETLTTTTGVTTNIITLTSGADDAAFVSEDGVCTTASISTDLFPLDTNVWDLYRAGTENPAGTYTFTQGGATFQLTLHNGIPATFSTISGTTPSSVIIVTNFDNTTPDFSVFSLPSECSQFTCSACYQGPRFPTLSPSYSLQGALARAENGIVTTLTVDYSVSVDISRGLHFVDYRYGLTIAGVVPNNIRLSSESEDTTYLSVDGVCNEVAFNPNVIFPLDTNVWDLYAAGTESPLGTYNFTQGGISYQVTIVDGTPVSFTFSFGNTVITLIVSNFDNTTPDFSTFSLPSECSQFSCTACYSSAISASISILLLLTTLLMYFLTTL